VRSCRSSTSWAVPASEAFQDPSLGTSITRSHGVVTYLLSIYGVRGNQPGRFIFWRCHFRQVAPSAQACCIFTHEPPPTSDLPLISAAHSSSFPSPSLSNLSAVEQLLCTSSVGLAYSPTFPRFTARPLPGSVRAHLQSFCRCTRDTCPTKHEESGHSPSSRLPVWVPLWDNASF
jgi:hypothetical protein